MMARAVAASMAHDDQGWRLSVDHIHELIICSGVKFFPVSEGGGSGRASPRLSAGCSDEFLPLNGVRRFLPVLSQEASRLHLHCKPKVSAISEVLLVSSERM